MDLTDELQLENFTLTVDRVGLGTVTIDCKGQAVNTLSPVLAGELERIIERMETDPAIRAVVVASAKEDNFVAGADVKWLRTVDDPGELMDTLAAMHTGLARIERIHTELGKPVVAAIHGACLGGGLELALACGMRVASDHPKTQLGQSEVKLGLIPGAGGTQRLPRLVGLAPAIDLILTGRSVDARRARTMGLVDKVVAPEELLATAGEMALRATLRRGPRRTPLAKRLRELADPQQLQRLALEGNPLGRRFLFTQAEKKMLAETKGRYPAPPAALRAIRAGVERGFDRGSRVELEEFARVVTSPEAKALISLFVADTELKKDPGIDGDAEPRPVSKVGVLGGGLMGGGIAAVTVDRVGVPVVINEVDEAGVQRGVAYVRKVLDYRVRRKRLSEDEAAAKLATVTGTTDYEGFDDVDMVIEAVFEDLDLKRRVLADVEARTPEHAIFASNTSSLPISDIAAASSRPEQVIGMHYFSPVERMPLLEVVVTERTADRVTATTVALGKAQGKTVIVVNDATGFYTTRILGPYFNEVGFLLAEGAGVDDIDEAMVAWGFPVGPLQLTDEVGIDVAAKIAKIMEVAYGDRMAAPEGMSRLAAGGRKGRKNERGFYRYEDGKRTGVDESVYEVLDAPPRRAFDRRQIQDRVSLAMINEAALCLQEGILRSARDGDVGAVFGLGFPPYTGGPFMLVDRFGAKEVVDRLEELAAAYGERFTPAEILRDHAQSGKRFRD